MMTSSKVYNIQPIYDNIRTAPTPSSNIPDEVKEIKNDQSGDKNLFKTHPAVIPIISSSHETLPKAPEQPQFVTNAPDQIFTLNQCASVAPVPSDMQLVLDTFAKMEFDFNILKEAVRKVTNGDFNTDQLTAVYELVK